MSKCKYCDGMGYVQADVGQVFECEPCGASGIAKVIKDSNRKAVAIQCVTVWNESSFSSEKNYFTAGKVYQLIESEGLSTMDIRTDNNHLLCVQLDRVEMLIPAFGSTFRHVYPGDPVLTEKKVTH